MTRKILHPLETWLKKMSLSPVAFSRMSGIPWRTIYKQIRGEAMPRLRTMQSIQKATRGAVSIYDQAEWFAGRKK